MADTTRMARHVMTGAVPSCPMAKFTLLASLVLLLGLLVTTLAQPSVELPWHPPDSHSSFPHRAPAPTPVNERVAVGATPLVEVEQAGRMPTETARQSGQLDPEPPKQPPR